MDEAFLIHPENKHEMQTLNALDQNSLSMRKRGRPYSNLSLIYCLLAKNIEVVLDLKFYKHLPALGNNALENYLLHIVETLMVSRKFYNLKYT